MASAALFFSLSLSPSPPRHTTLTRCTNTLGAFLPSAGCGMSSWTRYGWVADSSAPCRVDTVGSGERGEGGWWSAGESEREGRARDAGRGERLIGRLCGFSHLVKLDDLGHCARHALDVKLRRLGDMVDLGEMAGSACERKKSVALSSSSSRFFLFLVFWLGHGCSVQSRTRLRRLRQP